MLRLNSITAQRGATHKRKRLGRGPGSGHGQTAGKGDKGQLARSGGSVRPGFEGGQMPLYRRIPKRGFTSMTRRSIAVLNVEDLERWDPKELSEISLETLIQSGKIKGRYDRLNLLGTGKLSKSFIVKAHKVTDSARTKIEQAGGSVELLPIAGVKPRIKRPFVTKTSEQKTI